MSETAVHAETPRDSGPAPTYEGVDTARPPRWRLALRWETALVAILLLTLLIGSNGSARFFTGTTFFFAGLNIGEIAIMALPLLMIVLIGEIDLSVAAMLALSGAVMGVLWQSGTSFGVAVAAALVTGLVGGALNGYLIAYLGLPSIAVTIGSLTLFRGIAQIILPNPTTTPFPTEVATLGVLPIPGTQVPYSIAVFTVLAVATATFVHATPSGRSLYAIGLQPEAAEFAGIRVTRVRFELFVLSGLVCSLAGVLFALKNSSASYSAGFGLELTVVAVVLFGGVSIFGGRGTVAGVVLSLAIVAVLQQALTQQQVQAEVQNIVTGGLLLASVLVPNAAAAGRRVRTALRGRGRPAPPPPTPAPTP
ncbi:rhamnose transport system permease protein [Klenkia soli]|uniref:Autoinducer 2 import system permease protein LsrD n=1 Tax=Klenkia soli TaxID=1052260 RepID=A0A1H0KZR1_9ACTN|nr:ABC transporter permease [Klenkia soli]SDO61325.1 rhamnose transport system permease protein [Klenkia soli]